MRLLDRYLLRELLKPLALCVGGFLLLIIAIDASNRLGEFQAHKLHFGDVCLYYAVGLPQIVVQIAPIGVLLALLFTLTNHARHHELTAMRAAGVSLWRMAVPYFAVGLLASVAMFAVNEYWAPDSDAKSDAVLRRRDAPQPAAKDRAIVANLGFTSSKDAERRTWLIGAYDPRNDTMFNVQVDCTGPGGTRWLTAERGNYTNNIWIFFGVREFRQNPATSRTVPTLVTNVLALPEFSETPEEIDSEINISSRLNSRLARGVDIPVSEILNYLRLHPHPSASDRHWLYTKLHGRLATPWTNLVVVLIALPFGAASGRRNIFAGVAGSIAICICYLVVQQIGLALGTAGILPGWLAGWLPNLGFTVAGVWLTARVR
ncbi:MAG: YjgP/YjgQ family permease [Verrucomicrobia bacterium]|nr:MAG: YjgP/YjgQ family permease [Verrucomicrobiota bacterium]